MDRELVISGFYRHFKDKLYQVKAVAYDSDTHKKMVVYQAMYAPYDTYVRPLDEFMSEVDHCKYPDVKQRYRFEEIIMEHESVIEKKVDSIPPIKEVDDEYEEAQLDSRLLEFLDARDYNEKLKVLTRYRDELDDKLIDAMAVSVDADVNEGPVDERYMSLKAFVAAHAKYECNRLR